MGNLLAMEKEMGGEKSSSSSRGGASSPGGSWLELKKIIAQKYGQGKDLSCQLIQHSKLHMKLMSGLYWVGYESFQHEHNFSVIHSSGNSKGGVAFATQFPFQVDVSQILATSYEPLNHCKFSLPRRIPQKCGGRCQ